MVINSSEQRASLNMWPKWVQVFLASLPKLISINLGSIFDFGLGFQTKRTTPKKNVPNLFVHQ